MIPGIILAAGASSRMGCPKALLRAGDRTFVTAVVEALRGAGVEPIVAVIRPGADDVAAEIARAGATPIVNVAAERGQLSSLLTGLDAVESDAPDAVVVTLVDVPAVRSATVAALLARLDVSPAPILRPAYGGRHGHPVVFRRTVFAALRAADPDVGAKAVLRANVVEDVDVLDPGVVEDVDTPDEYRRLFGAW